jgi:hypothetical protein
MQKLIRSGIAGVVSNLTIFYLPITYFCAELKAAKTSNTRKHTSFIGNLKWIISRRRESAGRALCYVSWCLFGYLLNFMILFTFIDRLDYAYLWVKAVTIAIVSRIFLLY